LSNPWLIIATVGVFILQILVTTVPFLQRLFSTVPLSLQEWLLIFMVSSSIIIMEEIRKYGGRYRTKQDLSRG
jgi:Ca2+-transporting ATPase